MSAIISAHNSRLLQKHNNLQSPPPTTLCNCRVPATCHLHGKCLTPAIIYKAIISTISSEGFDYYGSSINFKPRFSNHKFSLTHVSNRNDTRLSQQFWTSKEADLNPSVKWEIAEKSRPYRVGTRYWPLCTAERLHIMLALKNNPSRTLNKKTELISFCKHRSRWKLRNHVNAPY